VHRAHKRSPFHIKQFFACALLGTLAVAAVPAARAEVSAEELAELAQNPIGNLINLPFQNNTNFNVGPRDGTQTALNIQPVYPIEVNRDWNVITRTILPLIWQPGSLPGENSMFGLGDVQFSAFLSPSEPGPGGIIGAVAAIAQLPTDSNELDNKNWGLGPTAVVLRLEKGSLGSTARWSTTSGRSPATSAAVRTATCWCNRSSTTTSPAART
jgi:hypothetical protein